MEVLVTCKNEEDPFKNNLGVRVVTIDLSHCKSMQIIYDAKWNMFLKGYPLEAKTAPKN